MPNPNWLDSFPFPVIICNPAGSILAMNPAAVEQHAKDGGRALLGTNVLDCHPSPSKEKLEALLRTGETNSYTVEKNGNRRFIHQFPLQENGCYTGYAELVIDIPTPLPNIERK